jgi:phage repressor protein C with HTH and peptisase S24 domain
MTENEEFAKMVREVIFYHNINQSQLAEKLGCKQSYISDVKRGKKPVSDKIMESLRKIWEEVKADNATKNSEDSTMKQRMNEFLAYIDMSQGKFEKSVDMSNGWVNKIGDSIREDNLKKISEVYPMLNIAWLKTGVGSMLNNGESEETLYTPKEEHSQTTESENTAKLVLLLPVSAQGGSLNDFVVSVKESDCEKVVSPIRGVDFAMTVSGDSMSPEYPNGSRIFIKRINERAFIEWGKTYVLDTCNGTVIKILVPSEKEGYVRCVSINTDPIFAPFEVALEDIYGVYKVLICMSVK